jgi:creatinine amidohydrolase
MGEALPGFWQDLPTTAFRAFDPARSVAVLPVAAIEQHGPHLPVSTDATINEGIVRRAMALLPDGAPVLVLPMQPVGKSDEHCDFPGTLALGGETLIRAWTDIGASVARAGLRKLVIFNSHGGQIAPMQIVARELRLQHRMFVVAASWFAFGTPAGLVAADEVRHGIHGGTVETAMMLALRPELVDMAQARDFRSWTLDMAGGAPRLSTLGAAGFGWQAQDLNAAGACGDATRATAELGEACLDHAAAGLAELLLEVGQLSLATLDRRPEGA